MSSSLSFHQYLDSHKLSSFDGSIEPAAGGTVGFASLLTYYEKQPHFPQMSCFDGRFCDSEQMILLRPERD